MARSMILLVMCSVLFWMSVSVRARPARLPTIAVRGMQRPASCMTKWLTLSSGSGDISNVVGTENVLRILPRRIDESTSANITADNLGFVLGDLSQARLILDCMNKQIPDCRVNAPCQNDGRCLLDRDAMSGEGEYSCSCVAGFSGMFCQVNVTLCKPNPCQNGGTCQVTEDEARSKQYQCLCPDLYSGRHCERKWLGETRIIEVETAVLRLSSELKKSQNDARVSHHDQMQQIQSFLRRLGDEMRDQNRQVNDTVMSQLEDFHTALRHLQSRVDNHTERFGRLELTTATATSPTTTPFASARACRRGSGGESAVFSDGVTLSRYNAYCDRQTDGGGWTVFQRRQDGSVNFDRDWVDYQRGFGSASGEFWLGLDTIHQLTSQPGVDYELRVDITFTDTGERHYETFSRFRVAGPGDNYRLTVTGRYSPTLTYSMSYNNGRQFTTRDRDNDGRSSYNCAVVHGGPWWYSSCSNANLNSVYGQPYPRSNTWFHRNSWKTVQFSEMKMRPVE